MGMWTLSTDYAPSIEPASESLRSSSQTFWKIKFNRIVGGYQRARLSDPYFRVPQHSGEGILALTIQRMNTIIALDVYQVSTTVTGKVATANRCAT
jgi:hypothetical protein